MRPILGAVVGLERGDLPFEPKHGRRNQRAPREVAGVVDQKSCREVVGAVGDDVVAGEQGRGVAGIEAFGMLNYERSPD